jgi:hypothetical protein
LIVGKGKRISSFPKRSTFYLMGAGYFFRVEMWPWRVVIHFYLGEFSGVLPVLSLYLHGVDRDFTLLSLPRNSKNCRISVTLLFKEREE